MLAISTALFWNILFNLTGFTRISVSFSEVTQTQFSVPVRTGVILYGIIMPVIEELIFRILIFGRLRRIFSIQVAIIVSSLFFGVYHGNLVQGTYAFLVGIVFAALYVSTGNMLVPVMMHGAANVSVFLLVTNSNTFVSLNSPLVCIVCLIIAVNSLIQLGFIKYRMR